MSEPRPPLENGSVPRSNPLAAERGTPAVKAERLAERAAEHSLKSLAEQVLARNAARNIVRNRPLMGCSIALERAEHLEQGGTLPATPCGRDAALARFIEGFHTFSGRHMSDGAGRAKADRLALGNMMAEWRVRRPPEPGGDIGDCVQCGVRGGEGCNPYLAAHAGHAWVHRACWGAWDAVQASEARGAVLALLRKARAAGLTDTDVDALGSP